MTNAQKKCFKPTLNYTADLVYNFTDGTKKSLQLMGLLDMGIMFNSDSAQWWKGGVFSFEMINTHGKGISRTATHDLQGISAIEAGNHLFYSGSCGITSNLGNLV